MGDRDPPENNHDGDRQSRQKSTMSIANLSGHPAPNFPRSTDSNFRTLPALSTLGPTANNQQPANFFRSSYHGSSDTRGGMQMVPPLPIPSALPTYQAQNAGSEMGRRMDWEENTGKKRRIETATADMSQIHHISSLRLERDDRGHDREGLRGGEVRVYKPFGDREYAVPGESLLTTHLGRLAPADRPPHLPPSQVLPPIPPPLQRHIRSGPPPAPPPGLPPPPPPPHVRLPPPEPKRPTTTSPFDPSTRTNSVSSHTSPNASPLPYSMEVDEVNRKLQDIHDLIQSLVLLPTDAGEDSQPSTPSRLPPISSPLTPDSLMPALVRLEQPLQQAREVLNDALSRNTSKTGSEAPPKKGKKKKTLEQKYEELEDELDAMTADRDRYKIICEDLEERVEKLEKTILSSASDRNRDLQQYMQMLDNAAKMERVRPATRRVAEVCGGGSSASMAELELLRKKNAELEEKAAKLESVMNEFRSVADRLQGT
ncbi:hypothetical protein BJ508DRAFT_150369 [Ascobolus immersus RN42]|uniref:Uncharacterized protein n=1 Tax=Ascobolus immersus RN42 TaxID=1160509 RepID=A0A3N4HYU2_ASCIM|nr:hypothetical protein BJ508DRAFT_150369 [Ascobolus immersus RN42]